MAKRNIFVNNMDLAAALDLWQQKLKSENCLDCDLTEVVEVHKALGRITSEPVFARCSSPAYNGSAMDGIAVRFQDTIGASETNPIRLTLHNQYKPVNTGNAIPADFNAVIMIEDVQPAGDDQVEIISAIPPYNHVRTIGEDIVVTELLVAEGHVIRPIDQGAMLATNVTTVRVRRPPKALVIPTGSDLIMPGEPVKPGDIVEFNSVILSGYLTQWGASADRSPAVKDNPQDIRKAILHGVRNYDMVVINAGASAGSRDYTAHVLGELGEVLVHGVAIKPGKPVILAIVEGKPVIGLPGYPVSAVLTMRIFVRPLVSLFLGREVEETKEITAVLSRPLASRMGVTDFVRVKLGRVGSQLMATPTGRGAGAVMSLVQADGILTVDSGSEGVGAGEKVTIELLRDLHEVDNTLVFIGSHDNILDVLANLLHRRQPICRLSSAHVGSMGGILALKRGEAHVAGCHLLDEESGEYNVPFIKRLLGDMSLELINLAHREQGLLVPKGNPKNIRGFQDLADGKISFINRQRGAGTRLLTDMKLTEHGIDPAQVYGYDREEYTHMNVASAVALNLDFIPVATERYDLIIPTAHENDPKIMALLAEIRTNKEFRSTVASLGGYDLSDSGKVMYEQ